MGTRGAYGFKKGNELKLTYNHFDSYFDYLGNNLINEIHSIGNTEKLIETFDYIKLVSEEATPTEEQKAECTKYFSNAVSTGSENDWYCLLRELQGTIMPWVNKEVQYMLDSSGFINDNIFCEYYYIIDLTEEVFIACKTFDKVTYEIPLSDIYDGTFKQLSKPLIHNYEKEV